MTLPLDRASPVHDDVPGGGISFDAVPEPAVGRDRSNAELQQMENGRTHRGRDVFTYILGVGTDVLRDIDVSYAPCLFDRGDRKVGGVDEP